jgi:hypothetical protein
MKISKYKLQRDYSQRRHARSYPSGCSFKNAALHFGKANGNAVFSLPDLLVRMSQHVLKIVSDSENRKGIERETKKKDLNSRGQ